MSDKELKSVAGEDFGQFKALVSNFYGEPWEKSYPRLRNEIEKRLNRRDTNKLYQPMLRAEMQDLVTTVIIRYVRINSTLLRAGRQVETFEAMLEDRIKYVHQEAVRRFTRRGRELRLDAPNTPELLGAADYIDRALEEKEERRILLKCHLECLRKLPERVINIFLEYYETDSLAPSQRTEARLRMALRLANVVGEVTPAKKYAAQNKLTTMISRWRNKRLEPCREKCLKRKRLAR